MSIYALQRINTYLVRPPRSRAAHPETHELYRKVCALLLLLSVNSASGVHRSC